jgi:hypothetical protein
VYASVPHVASSVEPTRSCVLDCLAAFRRSLIDSFTARGDALFELTDAVLCKDGPVTTLVGLSLVGEHRRGHGALYAGLTAGGIDPQRVQAAVAAALPPPRDGQGRISLAIDVSNWLRPDAPTSDDRCFCHVYARGKGQAQMVPGWPYSFVAALEPGRTSPTALLDARRLHRDDDLTTVTAEQVRDLVQRLRRIGHHHDGDPDILLVFDAGYDIPRLAHLLEDLPVELLGRVRADRVFYFPTPTREPGTMGRPAKHGTAFALKTPGDQPAPDAETNTDTTHYGNARARAWLRLHPELTSVGAWADHAGDLPIISGGIIELTVDHLPGNRTPKPIWLWHSAPDRTSLDLDRLWQTYLRRFDLEHTFRFLKQTLGWTRPQFRTTDQADRWTWIILAAYTQLRLARGHTSDLRHPWEKPITDPQRLTPARVRRGFRNIHRKTHVTASAPKPSRPGPGRPQGSKNKHIAARHEVGKPPPTQTATTTG